MVDETELLHRRAWLAILKAYVDHYIEACTVFDEVGVKLPATLEARFDTIAAVNFQAVRCEVSMHERRFWPGYIKHTSN